MGDERLIRSTARRIAVQGTALVGLVVVALAALAVLVALHQQHSQADAELRQTAVNADDVGDPPAGTWIVIRTAAGATTMTDGIPRPLPDTAALERVSKSGQPEVDDLHGDGREFRVRTQRRGTAVVQVALDLALQHAERRRLVEALLGAGIVGLLGAAAVGLVMGRRAVRPLAQALAVQRDFVADASHELRTPLTLLSTRAQLLARSLRLSGVPPEVLADGEGVVRDTSRMVAVVDDLLIAAETGRAPHREPVALGPLVAELADSARAYASDQGIDLLSELTGDVLVQGNPVALRRAITALVDNAITHTPRGGRVSLVVQESGGWATVDVTDTGPGLGPVDADRIFDRFHSGGQRSERRSYGLGLSLALSVAVQHGGTLGVAQTSEEGTTFRLRLPTSGNGQGNTKNTDR
jgi:two-component system OmpR family sensor kinase